ncbi:hypothetical protein BH09SUM1_BH09SUM1_13750 [soil metagenome]
MSSEPSLQHRIRPLKLLAFDVDGVMTDGGIVYGDGGVEFKRFNVHDGAGFALARAAGLKLAMITGRQSEAVQRRAEELKVDEIFQGSGDKLLIIKSLCRKYDISPEGIMFVGDDLVDLSAMKFVGFAAAPSDAREEARVAAHYVTTSRGGHGAVREIIDLVLKTQDIWEKAVDGYLNRTTDGRQ